MFLGTEEMQFGGLDQLNTLGSTVGTVSRKILKKKKKNLTNFSQVSFDKFWRVLEYENAHQPLAKAELT